MTYKDLPVVAQRWYEEKAKTCFALFNVDWSVEQCSAFIADQFNRPNQLLLVYEQDGKIAGACGVQYTVDWLIPHPKVVNEWMWWGDTARITVKLFQMMKIWGKQCGAEYIRYVLNRPGQSRTKCVEAYRWEVL